MKGQPVQLTLGLPIDEGLTLTDFVPSESNAQALDFLARWPDWPAHVAVLSGPQGSGKTHLANIWADKSGAAIHRAKNLRTDIIPDWLTTGTLVLEDVQSETVDEAALFHVVNAVRGGAGYLLLTAERPVQEWAVSVPDLMSRLRAAVPVTIGAPDEVLLRQVFAKQFYDRQIDVDPSVVDFLLARMERSLSAVRDVVRTLDEAAFARRRAITKRLAAEVLGF